MPRPTSILLCTAAMFLTGAASAQGVLPVGEMPMPPSARDLVKTQAPGKPAKPAKKPRLQARQPDDGTVPAGRSSRVTSPRSSASDGMSDRIDSRPARAPSGGGLQLENDPRAVTPIMQNGRAGVGMKF